MNFQVNDSIVLLIPYECIVTDKKHSEKNNIDILTLKVKEYCQGFGDIDKDTKLIASPQNKNYHIVHPGYKIENGPEPERLKFGESVLIQTNG